MENDLQPQNDPNPRGTVLSYFFLALMAMVLVLFFFNYSGETSVPEPAEYPAATAAVPANPGLESAKDNALINPGFVAYLNLGLEYYRAGQFQNCIVITRKALEYPATPENQSIAYNNLCSAYNLLNMPDEAIASCEKALSLNPDYTLARNNLNAAKAAIKK